MCWRQRHVGLVCCGFSPLFREVFLWVLWSAYHLYGKPENSGENSNGKVHPGGNFPEKSNTFRGITFFPFLPKRPKFSVPFVWITSARLHVERKWKIYRYFVNGTTQSCSCFRCQKNTSTVWRKFFTEISVSEAPLVYPSPQEPHIQILEPPGMHLNELFRAP